MASGDLSMRQGHSEGITEICFNFAGSSIFTGGTDGNIKIWKQLGENDSELVKTIHASDAIYSITVKGDSAYVASDNNTIEEYDLSDGTQNGILLRFTSNPTHVALSESQILIAAASSDFSAKVIELETSDQKEFTGHKAPLLSVSIDPLDEYLATSSCDGNFCVWNISDASLVETVPIVKPSNDISNSESLCRMSWRPATGEDIAVPSGFEVKVYSRGTWVLLHSFMSDLVKKAFNCCTFSPCGRFLVAGSCDGWICIWDAETQDCLNTVQLDSKSSVCSLMWDPRENNCLAVADYQGRIGILKNAVPSETKKTQNSIPDDLDALFENEDGDINDFFDDDAVESNSQKEDSPPKLDDDKENELLQDDFEIPSTNNIIADNADDLAPPVIPSTVKPLDDDVTSSVSELLGDRPAEEQPQKHSYNGPVPTPMQPAFQPSSTPLHLSHRFMVWNSVGTIRSYTDDSESSIDVEFHDKQHHYALHFRNESPAGGPFYTMADLSMNVVALAAESTEDSPSKLSVTYYSTWEANKEWNIEMPDDEDIKAISIGESWIAVCTDARLVRMFSLAGMQRFMFSIPGPVVSMAAHTDQLIIVYHISQGFNGNQCLGYMLLEVGLGMGVNRPRKIVGGDPLPISKKSSLRWVGFSAEGTPVIVDTSGVVRMMNRGFCNSWIPVLYLNKLTKSRHDHYWVLALHENPQDVRAVLCKGSTYPLTLPRPFPTVLQYKLPFCEAGSEKSKFEEEYWRTRLFASHTQFLDSHGFETDDKYEQTVKVLMQQTLMKMFALACKSDRESRAVEFCNLMPSSSSVNLAIKYASKMKRLILAQKLGEVVREKKEEEMQAVYKSQNQQYDEDSDDDNDNPNEYKRSLEAGYSRASTEWSQHKRKESTDRNAEDMDADLTSQVTDSNVDDLPDLSRKPSQPVIKLSASSRNPFKKKTSVPAQSPLSQTSASGDSSGPLKPTSVLDSIPSKSSAQKLRGVIAKSHSASKKRPPKETKKQQTLFESKSKFHLTSTPKGKGPPEKSADESKVGEQVLRDIRNEVTTSGVLLYISEVRTKLTAEHPDLDTVDVRKMAIADFKKLSPEEREMWNEKAKNINTDKTVSTAKRKLQDGDCVEVENVPQTEDDNDQQQPSSKIRKSDNADLNASNPSAKLAAFAYGDDE